jgi:mono/diheme cytochrome c family protein
VPRWRAGASSPAKLAYSHAVWRASLVLVAACAAGAPRPAADPPAPAPPVPARTVDVPISDPAEYAIDRVSRDAGERIFATTGIGDPYRTGLAYPIFVAMMAGFPGVLGADTAQLADRFGFVPRAADPASADADVRAGLPVGMHLTTDPMTGVGFVVTSCALCHAAKVGDALVVGLANRRAKIHAYDRAFAELVAQPRFTAGHVAKLAADAAARTGATWPVEYRELIVNATIAALQRRAAERAEIHARTRADPPGRVATIDSFVLPLHQLTGRDVAYAADVGWAKIPDVIGFPYRTTLSWDASGEGPMDVLAVEADVAAGVRVAWLDGHPFQGSSLGAYLRQPAPRPPFPGRIDRAAAARGRRSFADNCTPCHGSYDGRVDYEEKVVPLADIGTDPARALAATDSFVAAANEPSLTRGYTRFRRTAGYVPPVLVDVWARAPYGHAGQWPSLRFLATPPARRPHRFTVAYDAPYDLDAVGLSTEPHGRGDYAYDADAPGFGVDGHPFLADLGEADAADVIEYLKTL